MGSCSILSCLINEYTIPCPHYNIKRAVVDQIQGSLDNSVSHWSTRTFSEAWVQNVPLPNCFLTIAIQRPEPRDSIATFDYDCSLMLVILT